jgi:hypothetical protein
MAAIEGASQFGHLLFEPADTTLQNVDLSDAHVGQLIVNACRAAC